MDEIIEKLKELWEGLSSKMKMIIIGSGALVALIVLIVYVASESHEEKIERFQSEIRPYYQSEMSSCLKSFPIDGVKLEGKMNTTTKEGWHGGSAGTNTELIKNQTMIFNLEVVGPNGIDYKQNWAELAILGLNKKIEDDDHKAYANYFGEDLEKYGFLEVKSMILTTIYDWIGNIEEDEADESYGNVPSFSETESFSDWDKSRYACLEGYCERETGHMYVVDFSKENMNEDRFKDIKGYIHKPSSTSELRGKYFLGFNSSFGGREDIQISTEITRAQYDSYLKFYAELK